LSLIELIELPANGDSRGQLVALESGKNVPFEFKRVYYIFDTAQGVARGFHAHKNLKQVLVCVSGSCRVVLDDGASRQEVWLDKPTQGLLVCDMVWRELHDLSEGCVLLVLADQYYYENDYIRDYDEFLGQLAWKS